MLGSLAASCGVWLWRSRHELRQPTPSAFPPGRGSARAGRARAGGGHPSEVRRRRGSSSPPDLRPRQGRHDRRDGAPRRAARQSVPGRDRAISAPRLLLPLAFQRGRACGTARRYRLGSRRSDDLVCGIRVADADDRARHLARNRALPALLVLLFSVTGSLRLLLGRSRLELVLMPRPASPAGCSRAPGSPSTSRRHPAWCWRSTVVSASRAAPRCLRPSPRGGRRLQSSTWVGGATFAAAAALSGSWLLVAVPRQRRAFALRCRPRPPARSRWHRPFCTTSSSPPPRAAAACR